MQPEAWGVAGGLSEGEGWLRGPSQASWADVRRSSVCAQFSEEPMKGLCQGTG